jgi:BMFP domain-containing protein YqiC
MLDPKVFDDLSKRVAAGLPQGLQALQADLERNLRSGLEAALGRLNLVSREEFDVQRAVLARTREKLERLETQVRELEARLQSQDSPGG